jgi:hypothetical protein
VRAGCDGGHRTQRRVVAALFDLCHLAWEFATGCPVCHVASGDGRHARTAGQAYMAGLAGSGDGRLMDSGTHATVHHVRAGIGWLLPEHREAHVRDATRAVATGVEVRDA